MLKTYKNITIRSTEQGIEISRPVPLQRLFKDEHSIRGGLPAFLFLLISLHIGGFFLFTPILSPLMPSESIWWMFVLSACWIILEASGFYVLRKTFWEQDIIRFHEGTMTIRSYTGITETISCHDIQQITHVRTAPQGNGLLFEDGGKTIWCYKGLDVSSANFLVNMVSEILRFHCHSTTCLVFGSPIISDCDASTTLRTPDVSNLTIPFVRLQQLIIHTATYDFHLLERFFMYAMNYIGREYLKEKFEVHIYGELERLHANIRNHCLNNYKRFLSIMTMGRFSS